MTAVRAVRVVTEVAAVDRPFDYALTESTSQCSVGDRVRVDFNNRSVRGWVIDIVESDRELKPLSKWLGYGPPASLIALLQWASLRWCSPLSRFLISTSPKRLVTQLPQSPQPSALRGPVATSILSVEPGVLQLSPTTDPLPLILGAYERTRGTGGSLLVLVPTESWARRLRGRLEQRGCAVASREGEWERMRAGWPVVVGSRGTALAPVPRVAGAVVIDADDEAYRSEAAPTWDALTILRERCRREDAPLWATSVVPSPALLDDGPYEAIGDVAGGWPRVITVDRRNSDPRDGVLSGETLARAHRALTADEPVAVVVILQRLGTGRLFACRKCGELARCVQCGQAEEEVERSLACRDRHEVRANFCRACGATNLKRVRVGVTTLARDVAAQLGQPVTEVTSATNEDAPLTRVVVGTEAVFQRVRKCSLVVFVDFDQYLLAPRAAARRDAISSVAKAGRLVGSRRDGRGEVVLQTRRGDDVVIDALTNADFEAIIADDVATAKLLSLAPYGASATVTGEGAADFVAQLGDPVSVHAVDHGFVVRTQDVDALCLALRSASRPSGRVRIAVD